MVMTETVTEEKVREIFDKVKLQLRANPYNYDQLQFCGAVCCIAGWVDVVVNGLESHLKKSSYEVETDALIAIGEENSMENPVLWIFSSANSWPPDLKSKFIAAFVNAAAVPVACEAIDRYLSERYVETPLHTLPEMTTVKTPLDGLRF